jgi:GTPase SAR1 family protein
LAFFRKRRSRIGIYGPPNAGKTSLANRICKDWLGEEMGKVSKIPHETREVNVKEKVNITYKGKTLGSLFKDIVKNSEEKKQQIDVLITDLRGMIKLLRFLIKLYRRLASLLRVTQRLGNSPLKHKHTGFYLSR